MSVVHDRATKYTAAVREHMRRAGHATNADIIDVLRATYPELSATTVHRITARLVERGELRLAPSGRENVMRFDANVAPHDHFICEQCGLMKDAVLGEEVRPVLERAIGDGCSISGNLTVFGVCKYCREVKGE